MSQELSVLGKRLPLKDGYEKVTGSLKFAVDIDLPGMLWAKVLRSPYPHARIVKIDTSRAESLAGVVAVITYKDVPREEWTEKAWNYRGRVLDDKVRFVGDEIAAVAARDIRTAEEALNLIAVEYEELPHVFDIEEAMKPDAPQVSPHGNVRPVSIVEWGDIEKGFAEAELIVEHRTRSGWQQQAPLGRNACLASWERDKLTVWTSTQTPFQLRDELARLLNMPQSKVRVIGLPTGPSFGLWWANNFHFVTVFLARKAGKPVKLELTQEEAFATVKRRDIAASYGKLGVKRDGSFTAIQFKHYFDNGAHGFKSNPYESASDLWGGKTPHGRFEMYGVSTNRVTAGCMRGVGDITMTFCLEQLIDKAAEKLGMDPLAIRLKNHMRTGDPIRGQSYFYKEAGFPTPTLSSCGLDECIRKGAEIINWGETWKGWGKPTEVNETKRRGVGMAVAAHICGSKRMGCPSAVVTVNRDGSANLFTGIALIGQGGETTQAQIAAEELGMPFESIVGTHGDTELCPWCPYTIGSVGAHKIGLATQAAAADAKRQLCEIASKELAVEPQGLDIKNGIIYVKRQPERRVAIADLLGRIAPGALTAPIVIGRASKDPPDSPLAKMFMAHFVEVEVDTETGEVKILRFVAVHDSGRLINPEVCENQVSGGVILGCGLTLTEKLAFDEKTGIVINPNYSDYKILTALDTPPIDISFAEVIDPIGPFGVKGIGEGAACPVAPAITQAIYNAIGIWFKELPVTPEKVLKALKEGREEYP